jgi:hypothetical protein
MALEQTRMKSSRLSIRKTYLEPHRLQNQSPERPSPNLLPKNTAHRRPHPHTQLKLIQTQVAPVRVHDPVIMHHSDHQTTRKRMPVEKSNRRHREGQQAVP